MTQFQINWRPSGGRGEFEFTPIDEAFEGKTIDLNVPVNGLNYTVKTDTFLIRKDGKRRLRRLNPNDRSHLSLPVLIASLMGLPKPTRDRDNISEPSLHEGKWALGHLTLRIESNPSSSTLIVTPIDLQPRHFSEAISFEERLLSLETLASNNDELGVAVQQHFSSIKSGLTTTQIENSANSVNEVFGKVHTDIPQLANPEDFAAAEALAKLDDNCSEASAVEGKKRWVAHYLRERKQSVIAAKKARFLLVHGKIFCECCKMCPGEVYGEELPGLIEAHHSVPLHMCGDDEVRSTNTSDLVLLCRNCHGAIHRIKPMPSVQELRSLLKMKWKPTHEN